MAEFWNPTGQFAGSVASLEDKIVQRAVCEVLNAVYEADFKGFVRRDAARGE